MFTVQDDNGNDNNGYNMNEEIQKSTKECASIVKAFANSITPRSDDKTIMVLLMY